VSDQYRTMLISTDAQHGLFLHTLHGELHLAPLEEGIRNALDIGTGTGVWAADFGRSVKLCVACV
jgi:hypothetical protein